MSTKENMAAIWLGNFKTLGEFKTFFEPDYKLIDEESINAIYSPFRIEFKIFESYDDDFVDKVVSNEKMEKVSISNLLESIEFLKKNNFPKEESNYNCAYVIFDFEYEGKEGTYVSDGNYLEFYKNIPCNTEVDLSWMGL